MQNLKQPSIFVWNTLLVGKILEKWIILTSSLAPPPPSSIVHCITMKLYLLILFMNQKQGFLACLVYIQNKNNPTYHLFDMAVITVQNYKSLILVLILQQIISQYLVSKR